MQRLEKRCNIFPSDPENQGVGTHVSLKTVPMHLAPLFRHISF